MHDVVVLTEDTPTRHFESGHPITLRRAQAGTVVMAHGPAMFEVEFADKEGRPYALLPLPADKLIALLDEPEAAAV